MKKKLFFVLLLTSVVGWWYIEGTYGIKELVIEKVTGNIPEIKIENYINAVSSGDKERALMAWSVPEKDASSVLGDGYYNQLKATRATITQNLIAKKISPVYKIQKVEWWSTCCEPQIIQNPRMSGHAKFYIELTDSDKNTSVYIFDLEVPGGYDGGLTSHYVRNWIIDDIYPENKNTNPQNLEPIIPGWNVYENNEDGYSINYPAEWRVREISAYSDLRIKVINLVSPEVLNIDNLAEERTKNFNSPELDNFFTYNSDMSIFRYDQSTFKLKYGVDKIEALKADELTKDFGKTRIGSREAVDFISIGDSNYYVIMFENKGSYYEIRLNNVSDKNSISETQKQMISSFRFVN